jgi:hypothetical protein
VTHRRTTKYPTPATRADNEIGGGERWSPDSLRAPIGFHLVLRLIDDRVIAPTVTHRRALAHVVYEQGEQRGLIAFRAADTHLHIVMVGPRLEAGMLARYTTMSLRWRLELGAPFQPPAIRPLVDRRHLENAVRYAFKQEPHHGIVLDPFHDASSLPDLVGLRALSPATVGRFSATLPRVTKTSLLEDGGLALGPMPSRDELPATLLEATLAAAGLATLGLDDASHAARCAAAHAVSLPAAELGGILQIAPASVRRLRDKQPLAALLSAIKRQLAIRGGATPRK